MMSEIHTLNAMVTAVNAELTDPQRNQIIHGNQGSAARFHLYHAGLSICSQKVRAVLAEKRLAHTSHELVILNSRGIYSEELTPAENYSPNYVRLRMLAGKELGLQFATKHTGRSSVESEGFDACVVPTLVDLENNKIIVDSMRICDYLDAEFPGPMQLIPSDQVLQKQVMEQVSIIDRFPQPALLYGFHPDDDQRPDFIQHVMSDVYDLKIEALDALIEANSGERELVDAYRSKISKEKAGKVLAHDVDSQYAVRKEAQEAIYTLDKQLAVYANPWICGDTFTLADLVWAINLYRTQWLGLASLWKDLPRVQQYAMRLYHRPSIWNAVITFPSPMPASPHTADIESPQIET